MLLVQITGKDFGYDLQQWHDYLRETGDGGYNWSNKHLGMPRRISETYADEQWKETIRQLTRRFSEPGLNVAVAICGPRGLER